jgi:hypothetical protein
MWLGASQVRVLIECMLVGVVTESKTCHVYEAVLQTIKVAARNLSGASNSLAKTTT